MYHVQVSSGRKWRAFDWLLRKRAPPLALPEHSQLPSPSLASSQVPLSHLPLDSALNPSLSIALVLPPPLRHQDHPNPTQPPHRFHPSSHVVCRESPCSTSVRLYSPLTFGHLPFAFAPTPRYLWTTPLSTSSTLVSPPLFLFPTADHPTCSPPRSSAASTAPALPPRHRNRPSRPRPSRAPPATRAATRSRVSASALGTARRVRRSRGARKQRRCVAVRAQRDCRGFSSWQSLQSGRADDSPVCSTSHRVNATALPEPARPPSRHEQLVRRRDPAAARRASARVVRASFAFPFLPTVSIPLAGFAELVR